MQGSNLLSLLHDVAPVERYNYQGRCLCICYVIEQRAQVSMKLGTRKCIIESFLLIKFKDEVDFLCLSDFNR